MDYRKIIIVGENNIGRSFMAECILRGILQKRNCQNIEVVSRRLVVLFSEPVAPGAAKILREKGYRIEDFRSSQLTDEDLASADLVLAITKGLAEEIKESFDEATSCMSIGTFIDTTETEERIPEVTDYSFLRMLALITQLGISMLTCIFLCMIAGKFLAERLHADWIFLVFLILGILAGFRSCYTIILRFIK